MAKTKILICPYCGETQPLDERCRACGGIFEPLSRQATHNAMGPWFVRNSDRPFQPGCSYETLVKMVERGQVIKTTIVRGPTSKQFWTAARRLPGVAHLLGYCHNCDASVDPGDHGCHNCGVPFGAYLDRNYLGLPEVRPLPGEAPILEDRSGAAGVNRIDWQRAAEPMGISSFASDRDLRVARVAGGGAVIAGAESIAVAGPSTGGAQAPLAVSIERAAVIAGTSAAPAVELATSGAALRALQRRLEQQQRTNRLLTFAVVVIVVVAAIALVVRFGENLGGVLAPPQTKPAEKTTKPVPATMPATSAPAATAPSAEIERDLRHVEELMADAARPERPIADRIKDAEEAQAILKHLEAKVAKPQQPADLQTRLQQINRALEKLKLQQLFP